VRTVATVGRGQDQHVRDGADPYPIGASDEDAATAERLQFNAAEGTGLYARALARSVLAAVR
jgi:hypothetical protein